MIAVKVICVGKLKEAFYQQACAEYEKRLKGFCRLEVVELPEDTRPGNLVREAEKIRQAIPQGSYTVALCIEGTTMSSEKLSAKITGLKNSAQSFCRSSGVSASPQRESRSEKNVTAAA